MRPHDCKPGPDKAWATTLVIDPEATKPSPFIFFKTTRREDYDEARKRMAGMTTSDNSEILLHNPSGMMTEGSRTSVFFFRDGRWVTPPAGKEVDGGQNGTTRRWALQQGLCTEADVLLESVRPGEMCWVSNGARGFWRGTVVR